ncbi:uncharacterized protein LOC134208822 [Armigeres subalbatus]|uniref:uncharacterized protein LOC134208822 n=1 Tax=Armigeres subalbatus TaxID=124917 RepID=UPI002ED6763D
MAVLPPPRAQALKGRRNQELRILRSTNLRADSPIWPTSGNSERATESLKGALNFYDSIKPLAISAYPVLLPEAGKGSSNNLNTPKNMIIRQLNRDMILHTLPLHPVRSRDALMPQVLRKPLILPTQSCHSCQRPADVPVLCLGQEMGASSAPRHIQSDISIYYQNDGGINGLLDEYRLAVLDQNYDVIVFSETWHDSRTISSYVFGASYEVFRCDRIPTKSIKTTGGGVLVAIDSRLEAKMVEDDYLNTVEQVWVAVQLDMAAPCDEVVILGDFNHMGIAWTHIHSGFFQPDLESSTFHARAVKLLDNYSIATLYQINGEVNENNRSLDLCFVSGRTTAPSICSAPAPLVKDVAHHRPLVIAVEDNVMRDFFNPPAVVSYDFHKADHRSITEVLSNMDWEHILDLVDINSAAETFSHIMVYIIDRHVPKKSVRSDSRIPWMTNALRSLKRCKKAALRSYTKHRTLPLKFHYVRLNNEYKRISRYHFLRYQRGIQRRLRSHPKSFWSYVNEQRKETGFPSSMVFNSESASTQQGICNLFSAKFASVFEDEQLPVDVVTTAASNVPLANQSLGDIEVNVEAISRAMSKLKTSSKPGPDGVPSMILKRNITWLLEPLSLCSGTFPSC